MRIIQLTAENVKRLTAVQIAPDGNLVQITGKNGQGKTSVLDAIWWALGGVEGVQAQPIRKGAKDARIELSLGSGGETKLLVERRFTAKGSYLSVRSPDGFKAQSPQKMLDDLLGALTFDPLGFMRMDGKKQFETLRRLVPMPVDLDALDRERAELYEQRRDVNRRLGDLKAQAAAIVIGADWPEAEIDTAAIMAELAGIDQHNTAVRRERQKRDGERNELEALNGERAKLEAEIAELQDRLDGVRRAIKAQGDICAALDATPVPALKDPGELMQRHALAEIDNSRARKRAEKKTMEERAAKGAAIADELTAKIEALDESKRATIASVPMPVAGLGFGDGVVTFNGLPLEQASDAEQLMVSTAIAAALNPKLRVLRIRDGSLLDDDAMTRLARFADENDMQIWVERVDGSGAVGIVMEDGHVKGQKPAAEAEEGAAA